MNKILPYEKLLYAGSTSVMGDIWFDLMCFVLLLTQEEFSSLMKFMKINEFDSFITAGNVSEVYGLWFRHRKHRHPAKIVD